MGFLIPTASGWARSSVVLTLALLACGGPDSSPGPAANALSGPARGEAPAVPTRVVATAPAIVETLYFLGLGDRVVGVGDFATWPLEVEEKPRIGGLFDPQLETIAALEPDLAILLVSEKGLQEPLTRLGIEVMLLEVESIEDTEEAMTAIAARLGVVERAEDLLIGWRAELEPEPIAVGADGEQPRVLLSIVRDPGRLSAVLTANRDTFYQELLERMGAENLFADAPVRYPQVSAEEIVARHPSVLIELQPRALETGVANRLEADWRGVPFAGGTPCTRVVAGAHTVLPGPRLPLLYRDLRAAVAECAAQEEGGQQVGPNDGRDAE